MMSRGRLHRAAIVLAATALFLGAPVASAHAATQRTVIDFEAGGLGSFDKIETSNGDLRVRSGSAYDGSRYAEASYDGGGGNGFARGVNDVTWRAGAEVWYGAAYYLPPGYLARSQYTSLIRWDNYSTYGQGGDTGGIEIYGTDRRARLMRSHYGGGGYLKLVGPFSLPEGRWFWLEIHQILGQQGALSEVYLDGGLVGSSRAPNSFGRTIERIRIGLVAVDDNDQIAPLTLLFDRASIGYSGPVKGRRKKSRRRPVRHKSRKRSVVRLRSPGSRSRFGSRLALEAVVRDPERVSRVDFYLDGRLIATENNPPYMRSWQVPSWVRGGVHRITAKARYGGGRVARDSVRACRTPLRGRSAAVCRTRKASARSGGSH